MRKTVRKKKSNRSETVRLTFAEFGFDCVVKQLKDGSIRMSLPHELRGMINPNYGGELEVHDDGNGNRYFEFGEDFMLPGFAEKLRSMKR